MVEQTNQNADLEMNDEEEDWGLDDGENEGYEAFDDIDLMQKKSADQGIISDKAHRGYTLIESSNIPNVQK